KDSGQVVVGFAAETNDLIDYAKAKLAKKGCDLIVANDVSRADSTFGADTSRISLVSEAGVTDHETLPLDQVADVILDRVCDIMESRA
ncbi:MAG: phosphopantothenoylcysteine decarboxylase, partial [Atopobiaceae bacterium]|nr:phosphopantothenoylcysteine decarboxylase [Atopobiaceae bacterium]